MDGEFYFQFSAVMVGCCKEKWNGDVEVWTGLKCVISSFLDFLTLEDATDRLSWNVGKELPLYAV
jgi:hypothetical protein